MAQVYEFEGSDFQDILDFADLVMTQVDHLQIGSSCNMGRNHSDVIVSEIELTDF